MPCFVRWPGRIPAGKTLNGIVAHEDWMPTLLAVAGVADIKEKLKTGFPAEPRRGNAPALDLAGWEREVLTRKQHHSPNSTVVNITGSGNVVQAGIVGSTVTLTLDAAGRDRLTSALERVLVAVEEDVEMGRADKVETLELIAECKEEVKKEKPNIKRLASLLGGVAASVQTVGSLGDAWQNLKSAMEFIGSSDRPHPIEQQGSGTTCPRDEPPERDSIQL